VAYALRAKGYWPKISEAWAVQLGDGYGYPGERLEPIPLAEVSVNPGTLTVKVMKHPRPGAWAGRTRLASQ
jgi:hypothetical protein